VTYSTRPAGEACRLRSVNERSARLAAAVFDLERDEAGEQRRREQLADDGLEIC
jgi:hypothetical protein